MARLRLLITILLLISCFLQSGHSQSIDERVFIFGHSLLDHRPPAIPTPSDETTVPHWLYLLAQDAGNSLTAGGKYGFLPQHANDPPFSQWGYDIVPGVWESDLETFAEANVSTVVITAGNFMQWQGPDQEYPSDPGITPISATETVFDWVRNQSSDTRLLIYENWPDMAPYIAGNIPANDTEFAAYNAFLRGDFHDWWILYHDALRASRPEYEIKMVPVGPVMADILESEWADEVPFSELYEDDAPHGRPTLYFIASLITYAAVYQEAPPADFEPGTTVHSQIRDNYNNIVNFIMEELAAFNDPAGISRVFYDFTLPVSLANFTATPEETSIVLDWTSTAESNLDRFEVEREATDGSFSVIGSVMATGAGSAYQYVDTNPLSGQNTYRLRSIDADGQSLYSQLVSANFEDTTSLRVVASGNRSFSLSGLTSSGHFRLINTNGQQVAGGRLNNRTTSFVLPDNLPAAIYILEITSAQHQREVIRLLVP